MSQHDAVTATVRRRHDDDIATAAAALVRVHDADGYPVEGVADPVGWLHPTGLVDAWVAELAGHVVGHVALTAAQPTDDAAQLWSSQSATSVTDILVLGRLFVAPEARGHALGEHLTRAVMDDAARRRQPLVLDVMTKDAAAIRLYERLAWHRIGTADHTFGDGERTPAICYVAPGLAE